MVVGFTVASYTKLFFIYGLVYRAPYKSVIVGVKIDISNRRSAVFIEEGVVHYCVGNMPGAVPYTSTVALANATLRYGLMIANMGLEAAAKANTGVANGVNIYRGKCTNKNVAKSLGLEYTELCEVI